MQFARALGSVLTPLLIHPFLVPLPQTTSANISSITAVDNVTDILPVSTRVQSTATVSPGDSAGNVYTLSYGFLICGLIGYSGTVLFLLAAYKSVEPSHSDECHTDVTPRQDMDKLDFPETIGGKIYRNVIFTFFFFSFLFRQWMEILPGFYLSAFVVDGLGWDTIMGPLIASVFWGAHTFGLCLGIVLSWFLSPSVMLIISLVLTTASVIILTLFVHNPIVVWVTIGTAGMFMSTIFGSNLLLASTYVRVDGFAAAIFLFGSSVGYMTCYPLAGYLFQTYSYMWMAYLTLISCCASVCLFFGVTAFHSVYFRLQSTALIRDNYIEMKTVEREIEQRNDVEQIYRS